MLKTLDDPARWVKAMELARVAGITLSETQVDMYVLLREDLSCGATDQALLARVLFATCDSVGYSGLLAKFDKTVADIPRYLNTIRPEQV